MGTACCAATQLAEQLVGWRHSLACLTFMADMEHGGKRLDGRDR